MIGAGVGPHGSSDGGFRLTGRPVPLRDLLGDLWQSRTLLAILARKEFFVRYRRASLGLAWAVILPLVQATVLAVVVQHFVRFHTGLSYAVFVYTGTLAWSYFSTTISTGAGSIVDSQELSNKVYFPRAVFPLTTAAAGLYGLALSVVSAVVLAVVFGASLDVHILLLIPATALTVLLASAGALVVAVLQVYFRDMRYVIQAALIAWFYVTPVFYPLSAVGGLRRLVEVNPVTGIVELFRASVGGADPGWWVSVGWTVAWTGALLGVALALYRRYDRICVDLL